MSSGFITESEAADIRKRRQEEWERVRKADDPIERPEEPYDPRSLYERLQEQKQKRELEYEESHKLKNMIKGLDDDEIEFLDLVDRTKLAADRKKELEEEVELSDYRNRVAVLQEKSIEERLQAEIVVSKVKSLTGAHNSQQKLLKGVVVRKTEGQKRKMSGEEEMTGQKRKLSDVEQNSSSVTKQEDKTHGKGDSKVVISQGSVLVPQSGMKCVAILPGLSCYGDSSSENSSDSEVESTPVAKVDLLGRNIVKEAAKQ
ncbi:unnamed protein product [Acanthoscelides obtectus]|uniref:FAM192A/Fyv6 N-terminal domain-containing protein n=1 Tax=Acanthoscelides obtectus TaxID=200917 RepID=A0A9P0L322_ACAOB|nr:unnamed protein product [Acanthoscelides obtectus]CAK1625573.1 Protein FAM192A [Acanthoscelides obtectus]